MTHTSVRTAFGVTFAALTIVLVGASANAQSSRVVIRLYDAAASDSSERTAAMQIASAIVEEAGIAADWLDCTAEGLRRECQNSTRTGNLIVRIMPALVMGSRLPSSAVQAHGAGLPDLPLGFAVVDPNTGEGSMATIFHDQIFSVAQRTGLQRSELLGRALAHEIGHLLLGVTGHSTTGLMRAVWTDAELTTNRREDWMFAPSDERQLQCHFAGAVLNRNVPSSCRSR